MCLTDINLSYKLLIHRQNAELCKKISKLKILPKTQYIWEFWWYMVFSGLSSPHTPISERYMSQGVHPIHAFLVRKLLCKILYPVSCPLYHHILKPTAFPCPVQNKSLDKFSQEHCGKKEIKIGSY